MAFDELKILYDRLQRGLGSLYGADEVAALEGMYGLGSSGKPSDARHISAMSNLSDTLAGWTSNINAVNPFRRDKPGKFSQFVGDVGAFGAGLIGEIPGVGRSMVGKAPWSEIGEDVRANWRGTFGTPYGKESADIYREVYGGGPQGRTWDTSNTADRDFTRTDYGKAYQRGGSVNPFEETRQAAQDWSPRERYISRSNQDRIMPGAAKQAFGGGKEGINWRNYIGPDIRVGGGFEIGNIERANTNTQWRMPPGPGEGRMRPTDPSLPPWYQDNLGGGEGSFWNVKADQPWQDSGVMLALANSPAINKIKNIYSGVDPFFPDIDIDDQQIGYDFNKNLWGGTLGFGGEYDMEDDAYNAYINWGTNW